MLFFFFKQKTAYEMRISDWSSDVCSSDLEGDGEVSPRLAGLDPGYLHRQLDDYANGRREHEAMRTIALRLPEEDRRKVSAFYASLPAPAGPEIGRAACRERVCQYVKNWVVAVLLKTKKTTIQKYE